jgi:hypothetical protein
MAFFELRSARDVFEKLLREHTRLQNDFSIDNVFNFFVTAYHIQDYLKETEEIAQHELEVFLLDSDIKDCRDLCNKGKHLRLKRGRPDPKTIIYDGELNGAPFNALGFNADEKWVLLSGGRGIDVELLAERVLTKWKDFFDRHGLR